MEPNLTPTNASDRKDPLRDCVHCGLCLEACPTYRLTGDENNSPRGRLALWRAESEQRLRRDPWSDFYTDECVGCLACMPACPSNVPYGQLLAEARHERVADGRSCVSWLIRLAALAVQHPRFFNVLAMPARWFRRMGVHLHPLAFPGDPAVVQSTAGYALSYMKRHRPTGPEVALFTGCLMESVFREINFATIRVLVENNIRVTVPPGQTCCGALHEHTGLPGSDRLGQKNRSVLQEDCARPIVTNAAGCGLALSHSLAGGPRVTDVIGYLAEHGVKSRPTRPKHLRVFVDLPCHLVHGQRTNISPRVLDATGFNWELAPHAHDCCGSGGVYNLIKPANSEAILRTKAAFLEQLPPTITPIIATSNHVCMMQWNSARTFIKRPFEVKHILQLLDPASA